MDTFKRALGTADRPIVGDEVRLYVPLPSEDLVGAFLDVVFFADRNANGRLDEGESYASAWTGAKGTYRAVFLAAPRADLIGSGAGWNLCEGGEPVVCTPDLAAQVVIVNPVRVAVP